MLKKKIITAAALFSVLFAAAWAANESAEQPYYNPGYQSESDSEWSEKQEPFYLSNEEKWMLEKFKPREYIRIVNK
ncbi:hypothetical protein ACTSEZ_10490 [Metabacillus sp. JX24]|uniref:hypothetical protein n=1 Tax=Metabacillus sp. JX24 TaxID=3240759 RepID=UPI003510AC97